MENKANKSNCHKKNSNSIITNSLLAEVVGASETTVKKVLNGERSNETPLGQKIEVAKILLDDGVNKLITEVKKLVAF